LKLIKELAYSVEGDNSNQVDKINIIVDDKPMSKESYLPFLTEPPDQLPELKSRNKSNNLT